MSEVTFSIVIPSYNKAAYIKRAIDSVLNQSFKDFEIIVVENNSSDHSMEVLSQINVPAVKVVIEKNQGVSFARNTGIELAKGRYICFLDADDTYEVKHLEALNTFIKKYPQADLIANRYKIVTIHGKNKIPVLNPNWFNGNRYVLNNFFDAFVQGVPPVHINAVCVSKQVLKMHGGFDTRLKGVEDIDLWARIFVNAEVIIGDYIGTTYYHNTSNRSHESIHFESYKILLEKYHQLYKDNESLWPYQKAFQEFVACIVFGVVFSCIHSGNKLQATYWFSREELAYCPKRNALNLLKTMYYLPHFMNQIIFKFLRSIGKLNI
jgi:glycosyltransferase involved in cell wall biosynthesis